MCLTAEYNSLNSNKAITIMKAVRLGHLKPHFKALKFGYDRPGPPPPGHPLCMIYGTDIFLTQTDHLYGRKYSWHYFILYL